MKNDFVKENYLSVGEEVLYCNKPKKKSYPILEIVLLALSLFLVIALDGFLAGSSFVKGIIEKTGINNAFVFVVALVIHLVPLGAWLLSVNKKINFAKCSCVLITNKKAAFVSDGKVFSETGVRYDEVVDFFTEAENKLVFVTDDGRFVINNVDDAEAVAEKVRKALS